MTKCGDPNLSKRGAPLAMMREVLRLRRAEQLLRADNEELAVARDDYAELYDLAPLPLLTLGAHATIRSANLATAELFERERTWLLGRSFRLLFHALDRATVTSCLNAPGTSNSCTARLILPDDSLAFTGISRRFSLRRAGILHVALQDLRQQLGAAPTATAARRVLLVEDDLETSEAMQEMLERHGYGVVSADSVGSAVSVDLEGVDAIVSDIRLPDGLGTDLVRQLKRERDVPAIAFSGLASSSDVERAKQAGFDLFLSKPVDFTRLLTELATLLETRTARTAAPTP